MKILISRDTLSKIYLEGLKIRTEVFVKEQNVPYELEIDQYEAYCIYFVAYNDENQAIGTLRLFPNEENKTMLLQRLAILKEFRGTSIGKALVQKAEEFSKKQGYQKMSLHAQVNAKNFYKKLGYQAYGEIFDDAGIDHITMKKEL